MRSTATIPTAHARRYMIQLCKHFAHRLTASFDDHQGRIAFDAGEVSLQAAAEALTVAVDATDADGVRRLEQVIDSHLRRFAFREPDLAVEWRPGA